MGCSFFTIPGGPEAALLQPLKLSVISPLPRPHPSSAAATAGPCTQCSATPFLVLCHAAPEQPRKHQVRRWPRGALKYWAAVAAARRQYRRRSSAFCNPSAADIVPVGRQRRVPIGSRLPRRPRTRGFSYLPADRHFGQEVAAGRHTLFGQRAFAAFLAAGAATDRTVAPASVARQGPRPWSRAGPPGGGRGRVNSRGAGKGHGGVEMHGKHKMTYTRSTRDNAQQTIHLG